MSKKCFPVLALGNIMPCLHNFALFISLPPIIPFCLVESFRHGVRLPPPATHPIAITINVKGTAVRKYHPYVDFNADTLSFILYKPDMNVNGMKIVASHVILAML